MIVATAGHVDHGKTSLIQHITGVDTDRLAEEKERGLSINTGFAYYHFSPDNDSDVGIISVDKKDKNNQIIGFVDVPGHTDFINNMLAGVSAVDFALLIIAADDGVMPQTREHLAILDLLGISRGVIALTKIDRADEQQLDKVTNEIHTLVQDTCLQDAKIFPLSNSNKEGIPALIDYLKKSAISYDNHRSMPADLLDSPQKNRYDCFRYSIDRSFTVKGIGTVITGTSQTGKVQIGDTLLLSSSGKEVKVKGLRIDNHELQKAHYGQRLAININIPHQQIHRGDWLTEKTLHHPISRFDAKVKILPGQSLSFRSNVQIHLYLGAAHHLVNIRPLQPDNSDSPWYQIKSNEAMIAHYGDRFILRDSSSEHTLGGGEVIDIFVPRRKRSSEERLTVLSALNNPDQTALSKLTECQQTGVNLEQFSILRNCNHSRINEMITQLSTQKIPCLSLAIKGQSLPTLLHNKYYSAYTDKIKKHLKDWHSTKPSELGLSEPALSKSVTFTGSHLLFHALLEDQVNKNEISRTGTLLHIPSHKVELSREEEDFLKIIRPLLQQANFVAPRTRELMEITRKDLRSLDKILQQACRSGSLIKVSKNRYYLPETIMQLAEFAEKMAIENSDDGFTVIKFRDASGIGRNLCIEILEYFDSQGFTRRDGNNRFVRTEKENVFG